MKMSWKPDGGNVDRLEMKWSQTEHPLKATGSSYNTANAASITADDKLILSGTNVNNIFTGLFRSPGINPNALLKCDR